MLFRSSYVVSELQYISFLNTPTDVKGDAYEELVGENLRGDRGEYFTPRNVCDMVVDMVMSMHNRQDLTLLKVLDCCCGTGGYLVSWLTKLKKVIETQEMGRTNEPARVGEVVRDRVRRACEQNLFGLDINPFLVRTCQMNLVLHGDGSSNVFRVDSVKSPAEWNNQPARLKAPYGKADIVMTNPPFGGRAKIDDSHILNRYELSTWENTDSRSSLPAEQLFVEAALNFVKPGGILAILLPDGILNNPGLKFIRSWLMKRGKLIASVDLPKTTFRASGGVNNPSVLIIRKFTTREAINAQEGFIDTSYDIFMAAPETCGIDNRVGAIYLRHPDGREKQNGNGEKIKDDEVSAVGKAFKEWLRVNPL